LVEKTLAFLTSLEECRAAAEQFPTAPASPATLESKHTQVWFHFSALTLGIFVAYGV
jgi:hypothetical protein